MIFEPTTKFSLARLLLTCLSRVLSFNNCSRWTSLFPVLKGDSNSSFLLVSERIFPTSPLASFKCWFGLPGTLACLRISNAALRHLFKISSASSASPFARWNAFEISSSWMPLERLWSLEIDWFRRRNCSEELVSFCWCWSIRWFQGFSRWNDKKLILKFLMNWMKNFCSSTHVYQDSKLLFIPDYSLEFGVHLLNDL